jgi:hypothetical protein
LRIELVLQIILSRPLPAAAPLESTLSARSIVFSPPLQYPAFISIQGCSKDQLMSESSLDEEGSTRNSASPSTWRIVTTSPKQLPPGVQNTSVPSCAQPQIPPARLQPSVVPLWAVIDKICILRLRALNSASRRVPSSIAAAPQSLACCRLRPWSWLGHV